MYINVFTKSQLQETSIEVVNIPIDSQQKPLLYSTGIHPWHVHQINYDKSMELFFILSSERQCIAIGECGLDKTFDVYFDEQEKVFAQQVKAANLMKKPLILYCFKAWKEMIHILHKQKNKMPLIILYDYLPEDEKILNEIKDYFIAFDKAIYFEEEKAIRCLKNTSSKKILFFSADEEVPIKTIYQSASEILNIDIHTLQHQVLENFYRAFMLEKLPV